MSSNTRADVKAGTLCGSRFVTSPARARTSVPPFLGWPPCAPVAAGPGTAFCAQALRTSVRTMRTAVILRIRRMAVFLPLLLLRTLANGRKVKVPRAAALARPRSLRRDRCCLVRVALDLQAEAVQDVPLVALHSRRVDLLLQALERGDPLVERQLGSVQLHELGFEALRHLAPGEEGLGEREAFVQGGADTEDLRLRRRDAEVRREERDLGVAGAQPDRGVGDDAAQQACGRVAQHTQRPRRDAAILLAADLRARELREPLLDVAYELLESPLLHEERKVLRRATLAGAAQLQ